MIKKISAYKITKNCRKSRWFIYSVERYTLNRIRHLQTG